MSITKYVVGIISLSFLMNIYLSDSFSVHAKDIECLQSDKWNIDNNYLGNVTIQDSTLIDNLKVARS